MEREAGAPLGLHRTHAKAFEAFEHFYFASICIRASAQRETTWAERRDFERDWGMLSALLLLISMDSLQGPGTGHLEFALNHCLPFIPKPG